MFSSVNCIFSFFKDKLLPPSFVRTKVYVRFPKMLSDASLSLKWNDRKILYIKNMMVL